MSICGGLTVSGMMDIGGSKSAGQMFATLVLFAHLSSVYVSEILTNY